MRFTITFYALQSHNMGETGRRHMNVPLAAAISSLAISPNASSQ